MKNIFLAIAIAVSATAFTQTENTSKKINVPTIVTETFQNEFHYKNEKWGLEDGDYEAEFKINGADASAVYDKKGHRKALEVAIKTSELPEAVLHYLKKNYPTNKITETAKITDDKNVITYEAEIGKDGKSYDVLFEANGKFIKIVEGD
uniref:PepSY-like domain-containing protein n=1 Tax=Mariniflexile sp. TaxID=1979402 RepID=UPI004047D357